MPGATTRGEVVGTRSARMMHRRRYVGRYTAWFQRLLREGEGPAAHRLHTAHVIGVQVRNDHRAQVTQIDVESIGVADECGPDPATGQPRVEEHPRVAGPHEVREPGFPGQAVTLTSQPLHQWQDRDLVDLAQVTQFRRDLEWPRAIGPGDTRGIMRGETGDPDRCAGRSRHDRRCSWHGQPPSRRSSFTRSTGEHSKIHSAPSAAQRAWNNANRLREPEAAGPHSARPSRHPFARVDHSLNQARRRGSDRRIVGTDGQRP
jgi:hypothetical protein